MKDDKKIDGPWLLVTFQEPKSYSDFGHWKANAVLRENGKVRNGINELFYDFEVSGVVYGKNDILQYASQTAERKANPVSLFQFAFTGTADLEHCEKWVKFLRPIRKSLDEQYKSYGEPKTFGDYLVRVAIAMKAKGFLIEGEKTNRGAWGYDEYSYREFNAQHIRWHIERTNEKYIRSLFGDEESQVSA